MKRTTDWNQRAVTRVLLKAVAEAMGHPDPGVAAAEVLAVFDYGTVDDERVLSLLRGLKAEHR